MIRQMGAPATRPPRSNCKEVCRNCSPTEASNYKANYLRSIHSSRKFRVSRSLGLQCRAIDAAQPFDAEAMRMARIERDRRKEKSLTIGVVGFGSFGQFLARRMVRAGHRVIAWNRSIPKDTVLSEIGAEFFPDLNDFCEEHPEVVILCTSILSTESVLASLPVLRLKRNTLFVDVLSVKVFPKQLMLERLPPEVDILCSHPMFGPTSGAGSWKGLNFQFEKVRIWDEPSRHVRVEKFLNFFAIEGCNMVEMTCEEHDEAAASTQFITHTVGRMLATMELKSTRINTKGFDALLNLVNQTCSDSFELYYGLFLYNQNATDELERLEQGLEKVKKGLFGRLHDIARAEIFPSSMMSSNKAGNIPLEGDRIPGASPSSTALLPPGGSHAPGALPQLAAPKTTLEKTEKATFKSALQNQKWD
ncbi:hypothetical protein CEUSTIGMA_g6677.t1 [Chlamydomonas eustigma]|uniref:Prephenate/arogenate dehydrogenase domain-containing protein n=1 Tax=Chlamydomonas eustigma TaxID=1157962 RepID=A0A250X847_9CHLO|nr:hypothetical protein CEUSTIGMA_g6677.t1 [Chlamydomonas eustigma]|eukprot:GAX79237.1 hypothetical protein CEUSTIGMA_g6677.t1 [Chlamydomonas eustigma]